MDYHNTHVGLAAEAYAIIDLEREISSSRAQADNLTRALDLLDLLAADVFEDDEYDAFVALREGRDPNPEGDNG